ncbi:MAG: efflux RND transporter periplasmic adaptor subunit, partial [Bacteroidaceae bacterium]|nr:efflux RND transporter periplasmic adaptor subunit [Bacteroidaceae bacterium]
MKKINLFFIATVCMSMLIACSGNKTEQTTVADKLETVKVETSTMQSVPQTMTYTATVQPDKRNSISSSMPSRIREIYVEVGDHVKKGQLLVELDASNIMQQKVQLDNLELEYNRAKELVAVGGASQQQLDQITTQFEAAKTSYDNLMENTKLLSPVNGVVTARNFDSGDLAQGPILTVMQINPVKIVINVSETEFTKVKLGMPIDLQFDVFGDELFNGKVSLIYPTIDPMTRTFGVEVEIPNANNRVRPGMFARATIDFGAKERVVVPDRAVVKRAGSGDRFVYVYNNDGTVSYVKVELGRHVDTIYEVLSGLEKDTKVVVAGQTRLSDGV